MLVSDLIFHLQVRANLRELYLHDMCRRIEPEELIPLRNMCRLKGIKTNI